MPHEFTLAGLTVEILGREFPEKADNYWDANWLQIKGVCRDESAYATHIGPILLTFEIEEFGKQLAQAADHKIEQAELIGIEPFLKATVSKQGSLGHFVAVVELSDESQTSFHKFQFDVDQSQLVATAKQISHILKEFPVRQGDQNV